jgi:hypothetical protein
MRRGTRWSYKGPYKPLRPGLLPARFRRDRRFLLTSFVPLIPPSVVIGCNSDDQRAFAPGRPMLFVSWPDIPLLPDQRDRTLSVSSLLIALKPSKAGAEPSPIIKPAWCIIKPKPPETNIMNRAVAITISAMITASLIPSHARADHGRITAGVLAGLAVGTLLGAAATAPRYYAPAPVYVTPSCYWAWSEPAWDGYRWVRQQVQVCE